jgi:tetratricopeptide (TPR) repeat protein
MENGDIKAALADFEKAIQLNPNFAPAYINRGIARTALNDLEAAEKDYSKAIRLNAKDANFYINRGLTYAALNKIDAAITDYTAALALDPNNAKAYYGRGTARLMITDQKDAAQQDLKKAAELYLKSGDREQYEAIQALMK